MRRRLAAPMSVLETREAATDLPDILRAETAALASVANVMYALEP